jgi:hypothetical protein
LLEMLAVVKEFCMFLLDPLSHVARWRHARLHLTLGLLTCALLLVSCSGLNQGGATTGQTAAATPSQQPLSKLHWCKSPFILFRNEHAPAAGTPTATSAPSGSPTPSTLTDWTQIKPLLGFSVYLPSTLPITSCLVSASGTVNDPVFGSSFIIGYTLPDKSPFSFSEAPARPNGSAFQCTTIKSGGAATRTPQASPTQTPILLCTGVKGTTNIVFSGRGSQASLKQTFDSLQADVAWVPAA